MIKCVNKFFLLSFLAILFCSQAYAVDVVQRLFNVKDGLVNYTINDITFDDYGYIWLATEQGLFRVSSTVVRRVDQPDSSNALIEENISFIANVDTHHMLIGSGYSLYLYNIKQNTFKDISMDLSNLAKDDYVTAHTRLSNGNLLLLTTFGKVFEFDQTSFSVSLFLDEDLVGKGLWNSVNQLRDGSFVFTSTYQIELRNQQGKQVKQVNWQPSNDRIRGLYVDNDNRIWVLSSKGLFELNPLNGEVNAVETLAYSIHDAVADRRGYLWVNTTSGLFSWDRKSSEPTSYKDLLNKEASIDYIDSIAVDANGFVWIGGSGEGLALLTVKPDFLLDFFSGSSQYQLEDDMVWSIYAEDDKVWLGGNDGLTVVDKSSITSTHIIPMGFESNDSIYGISELDKQHVILATTNGLFVFDKQTNQQVAFTDFAPLSDGLAEELLLTEYVDPLFPGRVWWGTFDQVYYWEPGLDKVQTISLIEHISHTGVVNIGSIHRENEHRLWVGGDGFLGYIDENNNVISLNDSLSTHHKNVAVNNILQVDESTLWLGTSQDGLIALDTQTNTTSSMSDNWNLDCRTIYFLAQTADFNVVGCASTVIRQHRKTLAIEVFLTNDGFIASEFNEAAAFYDANAGLYIGSPKGAMLIDVNQLERRSTNEPLSLESIAIFYEESTEYHLTPETFEVVRPEAKLISFQMTTFDYIDISPISFKYRLVHENNPFEIKYIYLEGQTQINVADLDAGHYTLELLHRNNGIWADSPLQFHFEVEQYWWLSQWFKALVLFIALLVALSSVWFRKKQVKRIIGINSALKESEDKLRQSLKGSDSDLWEWNRDTDILSFENQSGILGEQKRLVFLLPDLPIVKADKGTVHQQWLAILNADKETIDVDFRYHRGDDIGWIRLRGRAVSRDESTGQLTSVAGIYTEISEQRELKNEIDLLAKAFENTSEGMIILNSDKQVKLLNTAASSIFETEHQHIIGKDFESLQFSSSRSTNIDTLLNDSRSWNGELAFKRAPSEQFPVWANISKMSDKEGVSLHYVVVFSDITQRKQNESNLKHLANNDVLTGLANRSMFSRRLENIVSKANQSEEKLALLFLDLDRFKHVNDSYGHSMGDALLVEAAKRLQSSVGDEHLVCRFGGDEFVILIRNVDGIDQINTIAEKVLRKIDAPFRLFNREFFVSTSIGISMWPEDTRDPETLIKNADLAMYHAKEVGRGNFQYYSAERNAEAQYHFKIETDLRKAIENNELELYYQPQIDILQDDKFIGMEALLRWHHPVDGFIRPDIFIKVAESCGLIIDIDRWVLRQACIDGARWHAIYDQPFQLSVNVSAVQFRQVDFIENLKATLEDTGMPGQCLAIEITEGVLMKELQVANSHLVQLKQLGIEVSIDDFGTGYSSLAYLRNFDVNTLKIDRSFLIDIATNEADQAIVSSIIELARNLKLQVVAEGIESHAQMEQVFSRGCYIIQGYYFAKPMPRSQLDKYLGLDKSP
ncbi:EAL domain-containing protein [Shewanella donghaensis]|uniref:EAL domain-containing protein n=1 Tax=Shewanella donghaensis TaxID=238836 RepID=UPI0011825DE6|nr:EAL domain-containing protein [Shewanella donghaensis]